MYIQVLIFFITQQEYNLLERNSDIEVTPTVKSEGLSIVPYSPLKGFVSYLIAHSQ